MTKLWFKRKLYGWGWTPCSWQGWVTLVVYITSLVFIFKYIDSNSHSASDTLIGVMLPFILLTIALILVCYAKGESPRWQWGKRFND